MEPCISLRREQLSMKYSASCKRIKFKCITRKSGSGVDGSSLIPSNRKVELTYQKNYDYSHAAAAASHSSSSFNHRKSIRSHDNNNEKSQSILGIKRKQSSEQISDTHSHKRLKKMDSSLNRKCSCVLNKLMNHQHAWPFNKPVDPASLHITDYFSIISHPMDLGTVKLKLEKNVYEAAEDFCSDVRLTFSNAMRYNPPTNQIHQMAKKLIGFFDAQWGSLLAHKNSQTFEAKPDKFNASGALKKSNDTKTGQETKTAVSKVSKINKPNQGGSRGGFPVTSAPTSSFSVVSLSRGKSAPCETKEEFGTTKAPRRQTVFQKKEPLVDTRTFDKTFEGSNKCTRAPRICKSDPSQKFMDEDPTYLRDTSTFCLVDSADSQNTTYVTQLSPPRELRAAMLKQRFADTIFKYRGKVNSSKMEPKKDILERKLREDSDRIEAEKAAKIKREYEIRSQRQAARSTLEKIEKSVDHGDNTRVMTDLAMLIGDSSFTGPLRGVGGMYASANHFVNGKLRSPLEKLGLFLKDDYTF